MRGTVTDIVSMGFKVTMEEGEEGGGGGGGGTEQVWFSITFSNQFSVDAGFLKYIYFTKGNNSELNRKNFF